MKTYLLLIIFFASIACNNDTNKQVQHFRKPSVSETQIDSLKWLFYAYSFDGIALFFKNQQEYNYSPAECDVKVDSAYIINKDTAGVHLSFFKEGYRYSHVYNGFDIYGFLLVQATPRPLVGGAKWVDFDNLEYAKRFNQTADSAFRAFLKTADTSRLSPWLKKESKTRGIF
jgi:hypothetical protein